jgi:hypothetical protein
VLRPAAQSACGLIRKRTLETLEAWKMNSSATGVQICQSPIRPERRPSRFSAGLVFSAAVSFGILGSVGLVFGLHQGMLIAPIRSSMMCSFDGSKPTFMMSGHWRTRLLTLTAR